MSNTYSAVTAPTTGTTISTSTFGTKVTDALDYLAASKPNARVFNSANISHTTSGTLQALTFNSERYDKGSGSHSTSVNTGRLTVPTSCGGVYHIFGQVLWAANATGVRQLAIRLNGTTYIANMMVPAVSGLDLPMCIHTSYSLAAGDYVELMANQTSGGALNVTATASYGAEFGWHWVST